MKPTQLKTDGSDIIAEILRGNDHCLEELYSLHRDEFIAWAGRDYNTPEEAAKDIFQEVILDFHQNVVTGKLTTLTSKASTYLFAIGKHKLINAHKRERRITYQSDLHLIKGQEQENFVNEEDKLYNLEQIRSAIEKLPEDCQQVLKLFYFREYDMESIAREMGYKNADTAKSKKSLCMKKLITELNKLTKLFIL